MNLKEYIEQQNKQRQKRIKNFIYYYQHDTLYNMEDYIYLDNNEAKEILSILSKEKNQIQVINEIILKTGKILPKFSLQFNQLYLYDGNICLTNILHIYKTFYLNKEYLNKKELSIQIIFTIVQYYYKQRNSINNMYIPIYLNSIQIKQLFYILYIIYKNLPPSEQMSLCVLELTLSIYKLHLPININNKTKKFLLNIIAKILIIDILNYYTNNIKYPFLKEKKYLLILDLLISNWNLLQNKYKILLKKYSSNWILFLIKKRNSNLEYKNEFLYIISKLE